MGNFFSDLFGGGKTVQPTTIDPRNPQRQSVDQFLANFIQQNSGTYGQPYTGARVAPMSTYQSQGLGSLQDYLSAPNVSPQLNNVQDWLTKTINGSYDPNTNPQYQAYAAGANRTNDLAVKNANADFGSRGNFFSTAAVNKIGDINAQTAIGLNQTSADLMNQERTRQAGAIAPATSLAQYISGIPLQKAAAGLQYGALPQQLDQQNLEDQYQDFIRQQGQVQTALGGGVSNTNVTQGYPLPTLQQNTGAQTGQMFGQIAGLIGNPSVQGALGSAGSAIGGAGSSLMSMLGPLLAFL